MKFSKTLIAAAAVLASVGANATLTASTIPTSGSFLALSAGPAPLTATLGAGVGTITGGALRSGDSPTYDINAFQGVPGAPFGGNYLAAGPGNSGTATLTLTTPLTFLSFLWGSPDTYNTLTVMTTSSTYTFIPGTANPQGLTFASSNGAQNYAQYVGFTTTGGEQITSLVFSSTQDAFETANFSVTAPVPEPETYALMLAGLGVLGFVARRRKPV